MELAFLREERETAETSFCVPIEKRTLSAGEKALSTSQQERSLEKWNLGGTLILNF